MSVHLNRKLAITLLFSLALLLAFARPSSANAISPDSPSRRDHHNLNRMIKRRVAAPPVARQNTGNNPGGAIGAGANPPEDKSSSTPSSTPSSPSPAALPSSLVTSASGLLSSSVASSSAVQSSPSSVSSSSSSSTSSSASTTTSTSTSSSTLSTSSTSDTPTPTTQKDTASTTGSGQSVSVESVTFTSHVAAASSSAAPSNAQLGASSLSHTTVMILIILAASIGGCAIVWTIIRKWKFRPSSQFEDRLEPVNWQPTEHESGLPSSHRRMTSNASSFHSAGHDNLMGLSRSNSGGAYNAGRSLTPLPDHDFTAGAAPLAPGGGYADLARGPSPQPQMQEALHRGPSVNRGYGDYPAPAHQYLGGQEAYDYGNTGPGY